MNIGRLLIIAVLFFLIYRLLKGWRSPDSTRGRTAPYPGGKKRTEATSEELVQDPQCGVFFPKSEGIASMMDGTLLFFCSVECRDKYIDEHRRNR